MDDRTKEFIVIFAGTFLGTAIGLDLWEKYTIRKTPRTKHKKRSK